MASETGRGRRRGSRDTWEGIVSIYVEVCRGVYLVELVEGVGVEVARGVEVVRGVEEEELQQKGTYLLD